MSYTRISESEFEVINFLWTKAAGACLKEICDVVGNDRKQPTIRTFLNRLKDKGYIKTYKDTQTNKIIYVAAISKEEYLKQESRKIVNTMFDGSLVNFINAFSDENILSSKSTSELIDLIDNED